MIGMQNALDAAAPWQYSPVRLRAPHPGTGKKCVRATSDPAAPLIVLAATTGIATLAFHTDTVTEDHERTRKDIRLALIFGIVAATLEMAAVLYFMR